MSKVANKENVYALFNDTDDIVLIVDAPNKEAAIRKIAENNYFQCKYDKIFDEFVEAISDAIQANEPYFHSFIDSTYCPSEVTGKPCSGCITITDEHKGMVERNNEMKRSDNDWYLFAKELDIRKAGPRLIH
jgi:hypothetical protein